MSEWNKITFSNFVEINPKIKLEKSNEYSFVEMADLEAHNKFCEPKKKRMLTGGMRFENGDTLFARITPCLENGKICQVRNLENGLGFGSTEFHVLRGKFGISDSNFIFYLSRWNDVKDFAELNLHGTSGRQRMPHEAFKELQLLLPPLPEQQAIAEVLSSLDDKIDLLHRNNKTLEEMAGALFKSIIKDSSNASNTTVLLHQIADINPETINSKFRNEHSEIEYLDTGSVTKGQINGFQTLSIDKAPSRAQRVVRKGDIIYSIVRPVQRHYALLDEVKENTIASTGFAVIRPKVNCHFIYHLLTSDESVEFLDMIAEASTSTYPSLKPSDIGNFEIALPREEALEQFHQQAELLQEKVNKNYRQINELTGLRNILLPKLMSGQVRVKTH